MTTAEEPAGSAPVAPDWAKQENLSSDVFMAHARAQAQLDDFGDDSFHEGPGAPLAEGTRDSMRAWLGQDPLEASRRSSYAPEDFGFTRPELLAMFQPYIDQFSVALDR